MIMAILTLMIMSPSSCDNVISVSAIDPGDNFGCWATAGSYG